MSDKEPDKKNQILLLAEQASAQDALQRQSIVDDMERQKQMQVKENPELFGPIFGNPEND